MTNPSLAWAAALLRVAGQEDGGQLRKALAEILASEEYGTLAPTPDLRDSIWRWIGEQLGKIFREVTNLGAAAPAVLWTVLIVCILVLAAIFIHGAIVLARALRAARTGHVVLPDGKPVPREDPGTLLDRAAQAAAAGQFTEAIRLCHRAALMALDRRGLVRFQECLTSGDYKRQLRAAEGDRSTFSALTDLYEPACFGKRPATDLEYSGSRDLARKLLTGAPS